MDSPRRAFWDFTNFIQLDETAPCAICQHPTRWVELNFQAHLHPGPCDAKMWIEFYEARGSFTGFTAT